MAKIIVAVGSTRRPKLNAVWEALTVFGPSLEPNAQFEGVGAEVESGVRHTPLSRAELILSATAARAACSFRIGPMLRTKAAARLTVSPAACFSPIFWRGRWWTKASSSALPSMHLPADTASAMLRAHGEC